MRKNFWDKRIPTLFGILIIIFGIGLTSYLTKTGVIFIGKATPSETPENVRITNLTDASFTISYTTASNILGSISYGKEKGLGNNVADDRDQRDGNLKTYRLHHITVRNLQSSTKYFFSIISGQTTFLSNDQPFEVTTGPSIDIQPSNQQPIVGRITLPDGTNPSEAIVYVTAQNSGQTLSTLVKPDGSYILPFNAVRSADLNSYPLFAEDTTLQMLIIGSSEQSNVLFKLKQISPVPLVTLSKNYDFTIDNAPVAQIPEGIGFSSFSANPQTSKTNPQILTPKKDEKFSDQQPQFRGTALPQSDVKITIHSDENLEVNIQADSRGSWSYRPQTPLSPGPHIISITTRDVNGILKTIAQSFTVYAQGSQVEQSATLSATPTLSLTPTRQPSSSSPSPSLSPTLTPTATPTQVPVLTPTATLPPEGNSTLIPGNSSLISAALAIASTTVTDIIFFIKTLGSTSL